MNDRLTINGGGRVTEERKQKKKKKGKRIETNQLTPFPTSPILARPAHLDVGVENVVNGRATRELPAANHLHRELDVCELGIATATRKQALPRRRR